MGREKTWQVDSETDVLKINLMFKKTLFQENQDSYEEKQPAIEAEKFGASIELDSTEFIPKVNFPFK